MPDIHDRAINESSFTLMKRFESLSEGGLLTANAVGSKLEAKPVFKQKIKQFFSGRVLKMDDNIQTAKSIINQWTAHQTKGHIDDIADHLSPEAVSLLMKREPRLRLPRQLKLLSTNLAPDATLTANRPFFFVITDEQTASLLFLGFAANPNE